MANILVNHVIVESVSLPVMELGAAGRFAVARQYQPVNTLAPA